MGERSTSGLRRGRTGAPTASSIARRRRAIELVAEGRRVGDVASELGVSRHTVTRWLRNDGLRERLEFESAATERTREQCIEAARRRLELTVGAAADTVAGLIAKPPKDRDAAAGARVQLDAALGVLDRLGLHPRAGVDLRADGLTALFDQVAQLEREQEAVAQSSEGSKPDGS